MREGNQQEAKIMFSNLTEPNETCFGFSKDKPKGHGVGPEEALNVYDSLITSRAIETGLIKDIEDNKIFIRGIGPDKVSDMITNLIRMELIKYTQSQCNLWDIPLERSVPSGYFWNEDRGSWDNNYTDMLVINSKKRLLVPKGRVSFKSNYTPEKYYNNFVLNYYQNENLQMNSVLVQEKKNGEKYVTKESLKEKYHYSKEFLVDFSNNHQDIYSEFKEKAIKEMEPLANEFFEILDIKELIKHMIFKLREIPPGRDTANKYHRLIYGILELVFYPDLITPEVETRMEGGRKRVDITFSNGATSGYFHHLHDIIKVYCPYIFVECKNYSDDPENPELDQLIGRFSPHKGKFGFLICRKIEDMKTFINRCHDAYINDRGLILPITDNEIIIILKDIMENKFNRYDYFKEIQKKIMLG